MRTVLRRALAPLATLAALTLSLGVLAAPASAHDSLISSSPADGEALTAAPADLTLTYSAEIAQIGADVVVTDTAGTVVSQELTVAGTDVVVPLAQDLTAGAYSVAWRVTSSDGHPIDGMFTFTLDLPAESPTAEPTSSAPEESSSASESATTPESDAPTSASTTEEASPTASDSDTVTATSDAASTDATTDADSDATTTDGLPTWAFVIGAVAILGAIGALVLKMRRDRLANQGPGRPTDPTQGPGSGTDPR
ncbi:copper resistance CopC family protein [Litorihabitans aurantiacus]|uniref:CopC domain-containing protein n=1 Tax=Litorihabitans aurantiacus TaxID=1930061 RepID=A0AA37XGA3_9MICO|nr:copper resistance CopC family protein [Litorihabitans aurantiacus]GMA32599.1 hypothetical protein GCM10025875_25910 [Litorihabitans aurantiacus]